MTAGICDGLHGGAVLVKNVLYIKKFHFTAVKITL